MRTFLHLAFALLVVVSTVYKSLGQSNPTAQSLPYTQNFGTAAFSSLPNGWAAWSGLNGGNVSTQALAEASSPSGNATLSTATAAQTTGGVYGYAVSSNARPYIQTSSNATDGVDQLALAINTTGLTNIIVKYDVEMISAQPRTVGIVLQYRNGTSGSWTTISGTNNPFSQAGGTSGVKANVNLSLPAAVNNQSVVQLRWAVWRGTETGNSSGIAIDNIDISGTSLNPSVTSAATQIDSNSFIANWSSVTNATGYRLDVYTSSTGLGAASNLVGWTFPLATSASQTADIQTANNTTNTITSSQTGLDYTLTGPNSNYTVSASGWDGGSGSKYWQIIVNATNYYNLKVSAQQYSSGTGPRDFKLQYKLGAAGTWTDVTAVPAIANGSWSSGGALSDYALPAACDNQSAVYLRWIMTSNTSASAATVASGGISRISNIYVKGQTNTTVITYVPGYQDLNVGNVTSYTVNSGLTNNTTYRYVVRAVNATSTSANSNATDVKTYYFTRYQSIASGNYNNTAIWQGWDTAVASWINYPRPPQSAADVTISTGHNVVLAGATTVNLLRLNNILPLGNNDLTVTGSITNYSSTAYVSTNGTGQLIRPVGNTAVLFPVGNSTYNPATLTDAGSGGNYSVRISDDQLTNGTSGTSVTNRSRIRRTWHISTTGANPNATMTLQWNTGYENVTTPAFDYNHVYVVHYNGSSWENYLAAVSLTPATAPAAIHTGGTTYTVTQTGIQSFSPFGIGSIDPVSLPIMLEELKVYKQNNTDAVITWKANITDLQENMELERSFNGRDFETVYTPAVLSGDHNYAYTDRNLPAGSCYYRLKLQELTGKATYSATKQIQIVSGKAQVSIVPNIVSNTAHIKMNATEPQNVVLTTLSMDGKLLGKEERRLYAGQNQLDLDVNHLPAGIYWIIINTTTELYKEKIIKQ